MADPVLLNTSNLKPMFKIAEGEEVDDSRWETDPTTNINLNPLNLSGQTAFALGKIPTSTPMIAEEIDARIQIKFEEQRDATNARIAESEYAKLVAEEHAIQLKERMAELKSRNMTVDEAREKAAMRGPDALANFESNFASPEIVGEQKRKESEEWSETARDRLVARLNSPNMITSGITDQLLDGPFTLSEINTLILTDEIINPATSLLEVPVHYANFQEAFKEGRYWAASGNLAMIGIELTAAKVALKPVAKGITNVWKYAGRGKQKGYDTVQLAIKNETELYDKITAANKVIADSNAQMRSDYIVEYERRINSIRNDAGKPPISISKQDENTGLFTIDPEKTREQGNMVVTDAYRTTDVFGNIDADQVANLEATSMGVDNIAIPILKPEKLDALIAIAASLKKSNSDAFKRAKGKTLIDKLFDMTVDKDLLASDELLDMLNKHGMSYEEYVLGVVGSGSQAGQLLQKLSQIGRARPKSLTDIRQNQKLATEKSIRSIFESTVIRVEGARRGILVSSWATTARNITSAAIVQPMHSIANLADAVLIAGRSKDNVSGSVLSGLYTLGSKSTWKDSFANLTYIFKDQEYAKEMTEYILKYPELSGQYKKMFDGIGEIQTNLGRGQATTRTGKFLDGTMSKIEDGVQFLNTPNRWQDHVMRRGTFVSELERRFKLEYGQDLQQLIKEGKIQEILNDTSNIRPDGAPSFLTLVEESTKKSMDLTFAGTPNNKLLEGISNTIVKSGVGTMFVPFPRFVMTSLEWMGDHTTGAFQVPLRKALLKSRNADLPEEMQKHFIELSPVQFNKKYKKTKDQVRKEAGSFTTRDREQITRNLVGWAAIAGVYNLRNTEGMSSDYKRFTLKSENENGEVSTEDLDVTAQYPMRQMSWIAEYLRRSNLVGDGTLDSWAGFDFKEVLETFTGIQARTGTTNIWVDEIQNFIGGMQAEDKENSASFDKIFGRFIGQYSASFFVPMTQIVTAQRAMGIRSDEMKDHADLYAASSNLEGQFSSNMSRSFFQNELFIAPSTVNALNERETLAKENPKRIKQGMKLFFGLNYYESDSSDIDFLKDIGWTDPTYSLGSKKREKPAKNYVNRELSKILPDMVDTAKREASLVAKKWRTNPYLQKTYKTETAAFNTVARQYIKDQFNNFKTEISKEADLEVNELALVLRKYKAMNDTSSKAAILEFREREKREPIWSNIDDLEDLIFYGRNIEK